MRIISMASTIRPSLPFFSASPRSRILSFSRVSSHVPQQNPFGTNTHKLLRRSVCCLGVAESGNAAQASTATTEEDLLKWVKDDNRRMLHVVYRVGDLDRTIKFYTECLGMKLLRKRDIPEEKYTNAFLGYGPEDSHFVIELTYNYGVDKYDIGSGFGHFGIAVDDVAKTVELIKAKGGKVTREPGAVKGGKTVIAFIEDPDGYKFELLERGPTPEPLCQVMLRVGNLDRSIKFYEKAFGMELLRTRDNPEYKYTIARKRCSLVCKRWLFVDGQHRHRLSLDARDEIFSYLTSMFNRFDSVTKLALRCDRKSVSLSDEALVIISGRCLNLTRVKLRGCREITDLGMVEFAKNCRNLKKLSVGSCNFGAKGMNAMLEHCKLLEELSVKRLRGIHEAPELIGSSSSLRSICLKELVNGQVFEPLVANTRTLKTLKIIRCLGDWDKVLKTIGEGDSSLSEIHLERLQVSDFGLSAISKCSKVETLHIVKTPECSNYGLIDVAERCKLLRKLHIDGWRTNRIGDEGLIAVAKHCLNLQELVLIGVSATHMSLAAIASNCEKLERLALCGSGTIGDTEIACIAKKCGALRKFCIKGCPVSDLGIEALAVGCPNLVKLKVKKCRVVTGEIGEWLRERRRTLVVCMDSDGSQATVAVGGESETVVGEPRVGHAGGGGVAEIGSGNGGGSRLAMIRSKLGFLGGGRNLVTCTFRRWSHNDNGSTSSST